MGLWITGYPVSAIGSADCPQQRREGKRAEMAEVFTNLSTAPVDCASVRSPRAPVASPIIPAARLARADPGCAVAVIPAILGLWQRTQIDLHLVSDATGETLNSIARATTAQFEHVQIVYHRWSLIRTRFQLHRVLEGIEAEPGPVLSTLVDKALRADLESDLPAARCAGGQRARPGDEPAAGPDRRAGHRAPGPAIRAGRRLFPPDRRHALRARA